MRSLSLFAVTILLSFIATEVAQAGIFLPRGRGVFPRIGRMPRGCGSGMCGPRRMGGCRSGNCGPRQSGFSQGGGGCGPGGCGAGGPAQHGFNGAQNHSGFQAGPGDYAGGPGNSPGGRPIAEDDQVPAPSLDQQASTQEDSSENLNEEEQAGKRIFESSCIACHQKSGLDDLAASLRSRENDALKSAIDQVKSGDMPKEKTLSEEEKKQLIAYLESQVKKETSQPEEDEEPPAPAPGQTPAAGQTPATPPASSQAAPETVDNQFASSVGDATLDPSRIPALITQARSVGGEQELIEAIKTSSARGPGRSALLKAQAQLELGDLSKKTPSELAAQRVVLLEKASGDQAIINKEKLRRLDASIAGREAFNRSIKEDIRREIRSNLERRNFPAEETPEAPKPEVKDSSSALMGLFDTATIPYFPATQLVKEKIKPTYQLVAKERVTDFFGTVSTATYPILKREPSGDFFFSVSRAGSKPLLVPAKKVADKWVRDPLRRSISE